MELHLHSLRHQFPGPVCLEVFVAGKPGAVSVPFKDCTIRLPPGRCIVFELYAEVFNSCKLPCMLKQGFCVIDTKTTRSPAHLKFFTQPRFFVHRDAPTPIAVSGVVSWTGAVNEPLPEPVYYDRDQLLEWYDAGLPSGEVIDDSLRAVKTPFYYVNGVLALGAVFYQISSADSVSDAFVEHLVKCAVAIQNSTPDKYAGSAHFAQYPTWIGQQALQLYAVGARYCEDLQYNGSTHYFDAADSYDLVGVQQNGGSDCEDKARLMLLIMKAFHRYIDTRAGTAIAKLLKPLRAYDAYAALVKGVRRGGIAHMMCVLIDRTKTTRKGQVITTPAGAVLLLDSIRMSLHVPNPPAELVQWSHKADKWQPCVEHYQCPCIGGLDVFTPDNAFIRQTALMKLFASDTRDGIYALTPTTNGKQGILLADLLTRPTTTWWAQAPPADKWKEMLRALVYRHPEPPLQVPRNPITGSAGKGYPVFTDADYYTRQGKQELQRLGRTTGEVRLVLEAKGNAELVVSQVV
jgi:hypothetical protein